MSAKSNGTALRARYAILAVIFVAAVLVRIAAATILSDQSLSLPDANSEAAASLMRTGLLHDIYWMPLYPVLIALTGAGKGQLAADILITGILVILIYALTLEMFRDRLVASLASLMAALYPPYILFSIVGLSEMLFITLVLAALYFGIAVDYLWLRGLSAGNPHQSQSHVRLGGSILCFIFYVGNPSPSCSCGYPQSCRLWLHLRRADDPVLDPLLSILGRPRAF